MVNTIHYCGLLHQSERSLKGLILRWLERCRLMTIEETAAFLRRRGSALLGTESINHTVHRTETHLQYIAAPRQAQTCSGYIPHRSRSHASASAWTSRVDENPRHRSQTSTGLHKASIMNHLLSNDLCFFLSVFFFRTSSAPKLNASPGGSV